MESIAPSFLKNVRKERKARDNTTHVGPASMTSTLNFVFSVNLFARTDPAVPPESHLFQLALGLRSVFKPTSDNNEVPIEFWNVINCPVSGA